MNPQSYLSGNWISGTKNSQQLFSAVTGEEIGVIGSQDSGFKDILEFGRRSTKLKDLTFHERARALKKLAMYLMERKEKFYEISKFTGATKGDSWIDIEGGIGVLFSYASKGRRELPDEKVFVEGSHEPLSKTGNFIGLHVCTPLTGVALHINAFNFPVWGMLEKLGPTFLAGMPCIIKPATVSAYLAEAVFREIVDSKILPEGSVQLLLGNTGDIFDHLTSEDVVTFTGSASTGQRLKSHKNIIENSIRFNMEADSLNCCILGEDVEPGSEEFDIFIKEVSREMIVKAGQKCTAIRRTIVPARLIEPVISALKKRLSGTVVGDPSVEGVRMGPLVGRAQRDDVLAKIAEIERAAEKVLGNELEVVGADKERGAFLAPTLFYCSNPKIALEPHNIEAFGPVNTVMPYKDLDEAIFLARLGKGSLVGSIVTASSNVAKEIVIGCAPYHGRFLVLDKSCAKDSTGHGSPMPGLVHGGPGRAGGGEEMGGIRGVLHYMQRTALQGSPTVLGAITNSWLKGGERKEDTVHPFRKTFNEIQIGDVLVTKKRKITVEDIDKFADLSGDHFYAHKEETLSSKSIFGQRVAHGYFIVSAAAGLFVDPDVGPVLANYGLENLRFTQPVFVDDEIYVLLTCKKKTAKEPREGEPLNGVVEWDVEVKNQRDELVATYSILTLVEREAAA